jgi:hypothetical protein
MAAVTEEYNIAWHQNATGYILLLIGIEIYAYLAAFDEKYLLRVVYLSGHQIVTVRWNYILFRPVHVAELLRVCI